MKTGKRFANSNKPPGWPDPVPRAGQGTGVPELGHTADGGDGDGGAGLAVVPSAMMLLAPQPWLGYLGPPVNPPPQLQWCPPTAGSRGPWVWLREKVTPFPSTLVACLTGQPALGN